MNKVKAIGLMLLMAIVLVGTAGCGPERVAKDEFQKFQSDTNSRLSKIEDQIKDQGKDLSGIKTDLAEIKRDIKDLSRPVYPPYYPPPYYPPPAPPSPPYYPPPPPPSVPPPVDYGRFIGQVYSGDFNSFAGYVGTLPSTTTINYNWGYSGPFGLSDYFWIRWEGNFWFEGGNYTFRVQVNDGAKLYVDDSLLIDQWRKRATAANFSKTIYLTRGYHKIVLDYCEWEGNAEVYLSW